MTQSIHAEALVAQLLEIGYVSSGQYHADAVHFVKDYAGDQGQRMRVHLFIGKDIPGSLIPGASSITVTTQETFSFCDIKRVPDVARKEIEEIKNALTCMEPAAQSVVIRTCIQCQNHVSEFYVVNKDAICRRCVDKRKKERHETRKDKIA